MSLNHIVRSALSTGLLRSSTTTLRNQVILCHCELEESEKRVNIRSTLENDQKLSHDYDSALKEVTIGVKDAASENRRHKFFKGSLKRDSDYVYNMDLIERIKFLLECLEDKIEDEPDLEAHREEMRHEFRRERLEYKLTLVDKVEKNLGKENIKFVLNRDEYYELLRYRYIITRKNGHNNWWDPRLLPEEEENLLNRKVEEVYGKEDR